MNDPPNFGLRAKRPKGGKMSLREVSAALALDHGPPCFDFVARDVSDLT